MCIFSCFYTLLIPKKTTMTYTTKKIIEMHRYLDFTLFLNRVNC